MRVDAASDYYEWRDAIVMTKKSSLSVGLIRTSNNITSVPFINSLDLRPLPNNLTYLGRYITPSNYLTCTADPILAVPTGIFMT